MYCVEQNVLVGQRAVEVAGRDEPGHRCRTRNPVSRSSDAETSRSWGTRSWGRSRRAAASRYFAHGEPLVLGRQLTGDQRPEGVLLGRVLDVGDGIPRPIRGTDGRDGVPAGPVGGVGEPGVVCRQLDPTGRTREHRSIRRHHVSEPSSDPTIQHQRTIRDRSAITWPVRNRTSD